MFVVEGFRSILRNIGAYCTATKLPELITETSNDFHKFRIDQAFRLYERIRAEYASANHVDRKTL